MKNHAVITTSENGEVEIKPAMQGAKTKVNGQPLMGSRILEDKDRVLFGQFCLIYKYEYIVTQKIIMYVQSDDKCTEMNERSR